SPLHDVGMLTASLQACELLSAAHCVNADLHAARSAPGLSPFGTRPFWGAAMVGWLLREGGGLGAGSRQQQGLLGCGVVWVVGAHPGELFVSGSFFGFRGAAIDWCPRVPPPR